ncbi:uncharacterized protein BDZ99DRAFT_392792 [Mytilinidion resinicola]|uniref:DUF7703 domain-containing protein n=1 Tax=Mytilinidion resinicola TaxID=574789 RepID=A0A6A6YH97_9PEZI|nr:uncharacterized protein BDZ99DRAFT_392792 [Mytilinidion resinicola]KAF2807374.1 hypothetical protein BDZ99DRAFT_392792 [Mytilinidion resinicola]
MTSASFHFYNGHQNATAVIVVVCSAISLYNALELLLLILTTFHVYRGLYFSSLVAASAGIILYVLGFLFEYFKLAPEAVGIAVDTLGWMLMVTGQSVVLYSRLGIVMGEGSRRGRVLKGVKWMIILDALIFHTMTTVVVFGAHFSTHAFYTAYIYIEKIQMTAFTLQEFILSGLYIHFVLQILRSRRPGFIPTSATTSSNSHPRTSSGSTRRIMYQLFSINVIIIALDIGLLVVEYMNLHVMEQTFKGVTYSVKLKLEFAILSKLVELTRPAAGHGTADGMEFASNEWTSSGTGPPMGLEDLGGRQGSGAVNCFSTEWYDGTDHDHGVELGKVVTVDKPRWLEELEKEGVERVERVYSRRGEGGADVLYADAMRSLDR